jgi:hypothetical protein
VTSLVGDGTLSGFSTGEPAYFCLNGAALTVSWNGLSGRLMAVATTPTDCIDQDFLLPSPG